MAYTSDELYKREPERFFCEGHWCYVGLEAEMPNPGDYKRTVVGERSVVMVRDADGAINVVENVCAHQGMRFCRERHGNRKHFVCPDHQWTYALRGELKGVPMRRGGVVFASFDQEVASFEEFLGADTDDCVYRLQPRENRERGFPLATLAFTSKSMLKDRV